MALLDQLQTELGPTYIIDRELTGGGMSRVFVATEVALGRSVVIKILQPELSAEMMMERFAREIQLVARLQQANIVPLIAAGHTSRGPFYTMPFVEGASLRQRLCDRGTPLLGETLGILRDVARALAYAHDAGVVHRDIKPENILLSGGAAVVTDFGIAKAVCASRTNESATTTLTQIGMGVGTPAYMAPEQAAGDPSVDHRADIYAFGCLAYELLTGNPPFHGRSVHQLIAAQIAERAAPLSTHRIDLAPGLTSLVDKCLEKNAALRPQNARELLEMLDGHATPVNTAAGVPVAAPKRGRKIPAVLTGAFLLALAVYAGVARRSAAGGSANEIAGASLAVIPFTNVGGDSAQDYLADGVSDELATAIGKLPGVRVTARSATYRFRGRRDVDVREAGKTLGARFLVQGTLRRVGQELRISAQLSDASDGHELWSENFDRTSGDVFRTQDDITSAIAKALAPHLGPAPASNAQAAPRSAVQGTQDAAAYDDFLRGEFLLRKRQIPAAIAMYRSAISLDTNFARAYAGLSQALALTVYYSNAPPDSARVKVIAAANRALARDSGLASAYLALGMANMHAWQWSEARAAFERAVTADPTDLETRVQYGRFLYFQGDDSAALDQWQRGQKIDPFDAIVAAWSALLLSEQGKAQDAFSQVRRAIEYDSTAAAVNGLCGMVFVRAGNFAKARDLARRISTVPPFGGDRAYELGKSGDTAAARAVIRELESTDTRQGFVNTSLAMAYLGLGDTTRTLAALERATAVHEAWPTYHRLGDPMWDPVRRSARWAALAQRVGLATAPRVLP